MGNLRDREFRGFHVRFKFSNTHVNSGFLKYSVPELNIIMSMISNRSCLWKFYAIREFRVIQDVRF